MYYEENNLHKIVRTNWWALPNLHDIRDTLVLSDGGRTLAKEKLQTLLDMFVQLYPQYKEAVSKAKECSQSLGKTFSIKMLKNLSSQNPLSGKSDKVFSGKYTWVKEFSDFWFRTERTNGETEPILLVPRFKANPDKTYQPFTYGLADITNIQTFVHTIPLLSNGSL